MTRETVAGAARLARSSSARGTANKFDDNNLMQEVDVDTHFSETHTGIERPQPIGLTAVPLKQEEEQDLEKAAAIATDQAQHRMQMERLGQQIAPGGIGWENWRRSTNVEDDRFNSDQPKGKAAEPFVQYLEGNHSHPVVTAMDDRRVRPYGMNEGEGAHYAPDGSEQMTFFNEKGAYLVSLDGKSVKDKKNDEGALRVTAPRQEGHAVARR